MKSNAKDDVVDHGNRFVFPLARKSLGYPAKEAYNGTHSNLTQVGISILARPAPIFKIVTKRKNRPATFFLFGSN